jgi:hypothetical protein
MKLSVVFVHAITLNPSPLAWAISRSRGQTTASVEG